MTSIIVDWQKDAKPEVCETEENHFKITPLCIYTKDGHSMEMEARMILQIDDDSIIIKKKFGYFTTFIEEMLSPLIRNFFTSKERNDITLNRLNVQKELAGLLQEKLAEYNVRKIELMMVSMLMPEYVLLRSTKSETEQSIKEIHHFENVDNGCTKIYEVLKGTFSLLILLVILTSLSIVLVNFDYNAPLRLGTILAIIVIIIGIRQYFDIRKLMNTVK